MEEITCQKCGSKEYYTELKSNNNVARCSKCDAFIKNIPYSEAVLYIGKYKGQRVDDIEDLDYLKWALENMSTVGKRIREAMQKQIDRLEFINK